MRSVGLLAAAAVIVVTNGIVLLEVARNRAGTPVQTIQLTERELPLGFRDKEDTGVDVRLSWQRAYLSLDDYSWLDRTKLESLGFDCAATLRNSKRQPLPRPAFVALEYAGPAWERWAESLKKSKFPVSPAEMSSRLVPVDAAKMPEPLLHKYTDRSKYLIVKAVVQLSVTTYDPATRGVGPPRLQPLISQVLPATIHVPLPTSAALRGISNGTATTAPRYSLTVAYGRRFEPWLLTSH